MDNYSLESVPGPNPKERRVTRFLLFVWLGLGIIVAGLLCFIVSQAFRPAVVVPVLVGDVTEYATDSINLEFINANFFDDTANKVQDTIPLQVVRDANGNFTVFLARSTRPDEAILVPRTCLVEWDDSLLKFLELCGGSQWNRDGTYAAGPAPRNLDSFPARIENGELYIDLILQKGAVHP